MKILDIPNVSHTNTGRLLDIVASTEATLWPGLQLDLVGDTIPITFTGTVSIVRACGGMGGDTVFGVGNLNEECGEVEEDEVQGFDGGVHIHWMDLDSVLGMIAGGVLI